jgi:TldD protein
MPQAARFRPFETTLDEGRALALLREATAGADDGELFLERRRAESLLFDDGRLKTASYDAAEGFGLRAVRGETAGYAHSTEISEAALRRAAETARLAVGAGGGTLAAPPRPTNQRLYGDHDPFDDAGFAVKVETLREIDAYVRGLDPRVVQVSASLAASMQEVEILRPEGLRLAEARPLVRLNVSVIVEENGRRESGSAGGGGRHGLAPLIGADHWQAVAREALRIATVNLRAEPAPAGVMDVVLGPGWPGILLHEAVGHGLEGDFNRKQTSAFAGLIGARVAAPGVTVVDDGTIPDRRGSISFDDEGTPSQRNVLIEDGILVGYMQDRQNARLMGAAPTGNGRRESFAHIPMPRMTNTFMLGGGAAPADVLAELKDGIYATHFGGGQVDITNGKFVFSCTEAYRVTDGKLGAPVKGATLIGDGATALKHIRAIGDDMALDSGVGTCGKNGQGVPVGVGLPTILIGGLTVGGSAA